MIRPAFTESLNAQKFMNKYKEFKVNYKIKIHTRIREIYSKMHFFNKYFELARNFLGLAKHLMI